ncbi:hypothetical protein XH89_15815 [Bradyrhizobium sp. CCBAU 53340]|uniref:hypothetical protein n=1 Tax=Bradyrhizobium sp. CCBAU 53340 TaxID=1325112 RepID=UPI00188DC621|nr:hypothetical protein [Bradyrhizobium sp. CCBAU 53340]QOZ44778.1 hypothetical protein XH89_15815 [Bradyrhizobium sp. CCBAU 53340]
MSGTTLPDGLTALRDVLKLSEIMRLIEDTARWVDPTTFRLLPLWYPEHARRTYFYKENWSKPQMNRNRQSGHTEHKREGNVHANMALTHALGLRSDDRPNWSCCHIWGIDDAQFQEANAIVQDRRFFSCVANMVLLPTPLKAFTDTMQDVKAMLRICARHLYGWHCDHEGAKEGLAAIEAWTDWSAYPESWPRSGRASLPKGVAKLDDGIRRSADRRLAAIRRDLKDAGPHYPRDEVRAALAFWNIEL